MPVSGRATQKQILDAIVSRLRSKIARLGDMNCHMTDQRQPIAWPPDRECVTVSVEGGRFPEPFYNGGGGSTLCESSTVAVTVWVRCNLDRIQTIEVALLEDTGIYSDWKPDILRALLISESSGGDVIPWSPVGPDGICLLRNCLSPISCGTVVTDSTGEWLGMTLSFSADFDWRL